MPSVPFLKTHGVVVQLLVDVIQQADGLNDHDVYLIRREFQSMT